MIKKLVQKVIRPQINTGSDLNLEQLFSAKKGQRLGYVSVDERNLAEMIWTLLGHNPTLRVEVVAGMQSTLEFAAEMLAQKAGKSLKMVRTIQSNVGTIPPAWYKGAEFMLHKLVHSGRFAVIGLAGLATNYAFQKLDFENKVIAVKQVLQQLTEPSSNRLLIVKDADQLFGHEGKEESDSTKRFHYAMRDLFLGQAGFTLVNSERMADRIGFLMAKQFVVD